MLTCRKEEAGDQSQQEERRKRGWNDAKKGPQTEKCWQPLEAEGWVGRILSWSSQREPALLTAWGCQGSLISDIWAPTCPSSNRKLHTCPVGGAFYPNLWQEDPETPRYRHRSVSWAGEGLACRVAISPLDSESLVSNQARAPKKGHDVYTIQGLVFIFIFLKFGYARYLLWHVGSSSLTRNQTWVPCIGSTES